MFIDFFSVSGHPFRVVLVFREIYVEFVFSSHYVTAGRRTYDLYGIIYSNNYVYIIYYILGIIKRRSQHNQGHVYRGYAS